MRLAYSLLALRLASACYGQHSHDPAVQKEQMKKLDFLVGKWSGEAAISRGAGEPQKLHQTEEVQYKLDGLVMLVEGTGRDAEGKVVFRALATIAYDDQTSKYHFRGYNDGRYLDTELKVVPNGFQWDFEAGPAKVTNTMRIGEKGEWEETTAAVLGNSPQRKFVEMKLQRQPDAR